MLAGSPAVLRAYTRMRSELRGGVLPRATRERIALAVAEYRGDTYSIAQHAKSARARRARPRRGLHGPQLHVGRREGGSAARLPQGRAEGRRAPPLYLHEEAREAGWTDEEILEAVGHLALNEFQSLIAIAAALPKDQATPRVLPAAA